MGELPNAVVKRLLSKHGGGLRVSGSALERAVAAAEYYISRLAAEASAECRRQLEAGITTRTRNRVRFTVLLPSFLLRALIAAQAPLTARFTLCLGNRRRSQLRRWSDSENTSLSRYESRQERTERAQIALRR